ncbi:MAG: bacteriohemerythrin [Sulfuritalea sp.]|nr:bacteriohemerythrin [Sulfuritalea sp.]
MKDITWSAILSVGVEEIDEDHRKLVGIFNELAHAVTNGESAEYLAATFDELIKCTAWHFSHEDRLMLKHGYPEIDPHRAAHSELIAAAQRLQAKLTQADQAVANAEIEFLDRWLTEHILTADQRLGSFLAQAL